MLRPGSDLRSLAGGTVLVGGAPLSVLKLSQAGASTVQGWFRGEMIRPSDAHQALARRLIRRGMATPHRPTKPHGDRSEALRQVTVVVPVKDDSAGLARTIGSLTAGFLPSIGPDEDGPRLIVVDDGSRQPVVAADLPAGSILLRNAHPLGPGPSREQGLEQSNTPLVAFIDAGLDYSVTDLYELVRSFDDPNLVAVAPRVRSTPATHLVGRYDEYRSPLDLGPVESLVGPSRSVSYVPTAFFVARSAAIHQAGGFDPGLRYGEDVDLVWRMAALGDIRYLPMVEVHHPPRASVRAMMQQRAAYGSAAAPLTARHGDVVAPARVSPWTVVALGLALARHPVAALVTGAMTVIRLRPKVMALPEPTVEATILAWRGHWHGSVSLLSAAARAWSPLLLASFAVRPWRSHVTRLMALAVARRLLDGPRTPVAAMLDLALGAVEDVSYAYGVWSGALKERSLKTIVPAVMSWPKGAKK